MMRARTTTCLTMALMAVFLMSSTWAMAEDPAKLELKKGDRIILIGNTLAERMQYFGNFETLLQSRFPDLNLVFHDLGWSADEITLRPRSEKFKDHGHTLEDEKPDVIIAAFGFNESFAGPKGLDKFKKDLDKFIVETTTTKYNGKAAPKLVLLSPIAHEDLGDPHRPDGKANNTNIKLYTEAMAELSQKHHIILVDLFDASPTLRKIEGFIDPKPEYINLTFNGIHLTENGDYKIGRFIDKALFGPRPATIKADLAKLKKEVLEKNLQFFYDYRAINGCYIYGSRKPRSGSSTFQPSSPSSAR